MSVLSGNEPFLKLVGCLKFYHDLLLIERSLYCQNLNLDASIQGPNGCLFFYICQAAAQAYE